MNFPMAPSDNWQNWQWLISEEAAPWLQRANNLDPSSLKANALLRKQLGAERAALVLDQAHLRRVARRKFTRAAEMFFHRRALEQATDERIAQYKAQRLAAPQIVDVCCGIGGDLLALAQHSQNTIAIDRDPLLILLARANARVYGLEHIEFQALDARQIGDLSEWHVHIDPDRRPEGKRVTRVAAYDPSGATIQSLSAGARSAAVKVAPAADVPGDWADAMEREWIESGGECRQQVLWFGQAAAARGQRVATMLDGSGRVLARFAGSGQAEPAIATTDSAYVYDPAPCVLAAGLVDDLAQALGLARLAPQTVYLGAATWVNSPFVSAFRVLDAMPFDVRRLKRYLHEHSIGQFEIKKRGVDVSPESLVRQLQNPGEKRATILITRLTRSVRAIIAERCEAPVG